MVYLRFYSFKNPTLYKEDTKAQEKANDKMFEIWYYKNNATSS